MKRLAHPEDVEENNPGILDDKFLWEAPRFEARYKGLSRLVEMEDPGCVVELAAGYSPRGLIMTREGKCSYLETDLGRNIRDKQRIVVFCKKRGANALHSG